ncbi:hypothetical protein IJ21_17700 [Paenibacillus sp. 32O-W]|nr:hypothetical protein IJ21_17700 [Paenibacillus sp. 32O-W]
MTTHEIVHYKDRCTVCRKRKGTRLCDYVVAQIRTSIDFQTHTMTCDALLCDECAVRVGGETDFCPKHANEAKLKLGQWKGMKKT